MVTAEELGGHGRIRDGVLDALNQAGIRAPVLKIALPRASWTTARWMTCGDSSGSMCPASSAESARPSGSVFRRTLEPQPRPPPDPWPARGPGQRSAPIQLAVDPGSGSIRAEAQALILAGAIHLVPTPAVASPPGSGWIPPRAWSATLARIGSRGAEKLVAALDAFEVAVTGLICLDAGASTGGFTDVLLRRGAKRVYALDVGRGQLLPRLVSDERVVVDRTNLRTLTSLPEAVDLATLDLSFISLRLVLDAVRGVLATDGRIIALVKPQFEAGRPDVPRGGVVRDPAVHRRVLLRVADDARAAGLAPVGLIASPRTGRESREFWLCFGRPPDPETRRGRRGAWDKLVDEALGWRRFWPRTAIAYYDLGVAKTAAARPESSS